MINQADLSAKLAADSNDLNALRQSARQNSPEALKAAAKQFEALFMNMVMKSMRDATPQDGLFDSEQSKMYTSMLDQQISQNFAKRGIGLADALIRQLSNNGGSPLPSIKPEQTTPATGLPGAAIQPDNRYPPQSSHAKAFQDRLAAHAEEASRITGIPAKFMLGQAALESGWGKKEIVAADGTASYNLFGIKATGGWKGKVVEVATTEYVDGVAQRKMEKFRAYDSYADSFKDYAGMLRNNPRYRNVLANAQDAVGFAQGLQRAGYATDPDYAAKLTRIIKQSLSA
ncbi:MAG: flgJ [Herminiimonas sp.]|nr:flgJ [Herminiimonas sp.]